MSRTISIASYSFHGLHSLGAMTVFQYLETIRYRYGRDTADIWNGMLDSYDEGYLKFLRQQMDERGLALANLCCDGCHLWGESAEERAAQAQKAEDCLRAAEILGAKTVRMDAGVREDVMSSEQMEHVVKTYEKYCARAANFGARLGPENHWGASTNAVELRKLFANVGAKNFGLLLHLGNWHKTEGAGEDMLNDAHIQYNAEFAKVAMHTHIMYEVCEQAKRQLTPLISAGYNGAWSVESHKGTNEFNNVAKQLAEVTRVLLPCDYSGVVPLTIPKGVK